ncbi:FAD-dependent oxidoreductase [Clostridium tetani]|uniref:FAD-dependent oxidoreductase n=1 Tax=Clostridium tetani TaxID=1513 RepID=UPI00100A6075|nr:FAD-dependent oxidoreductase [Clostridium tetani]RXM59059.1 FAD-dependent oxidoreductase [Clostridium tetani]RXM77701.1 FAD-dependent oxidoreductase [Clostridium tetani]RYU99643.1 FAD-dependent oxidoreductase [Clostridium tetani]
MNSENKLPDNSISYWIESTPETNYPSLKEDIEVDVAIIGGGIAGITSAFLLKNEGVKVAIVEGYKVANGTSGYTTAKITSQHDLIYHKIVTNMGLEKAQQYADANEYAIKFIKDTISEYNINCDFRTLPAYAYTMESQYINEIEKEAEITSKLGINSKLLDEIPLPFRIKSALCFENQAEFHPRKYLLPLVDKIPGDGSYVFENTRIVDIEKGNPCSIITEDGNKVMASNVIIATHYPCYDGLGLYFTRLYGDISYVLGTKINEDFPRGMFINVEEPGRSLRSQVCNGDKLILVGGEGHKTGHDNNTIQHYNNLKLFAENNFTVDKFLYRWATQDYITLDSVPYIGNLTSSIENIYVATGFGKWGMTSGTVSGILLKDLILHKESPWQDVFSPSRVNSSNALKNFFVENFDVAKELVKGKLSTIPDNIEVNNGEGKVIEIAGDKYGAYRDNDGVLHIVDITCTHLGCELKWNDAEKSWDCPCHASRFTYKGDIMDGPAIRKLNYYKDEPNNIDPNIL